MYLVKNRYFFEVPEFVEYEGQETSLKHVDNKTHLCLTTGLKDFPIRVIDRNLILGSAPVTITATTTKIVKGSKGQDYILTQTNNKWTCTCPGFEFRGNCKHVKEA